MQSHKNSKKIVGAMVAKRSGALRHGTGGPKFESLTQKFFKSMDDFSITREEALFMNLCWRSSFVCEAFV